MWIFLLLLIVSGLVDSIFSGTGIDFTVTPVGFLLAALISLTQPPLFQGSGSVHCDGGPAALTWVSAVATRIVRADGHLIFSPIWSL